MPKQVIDPTPGVTPSSISQAIRVGDTIFISGQVAFDARGHLVGKGDAAAQAEQCFSNIESILKMAGSSLADVVKVTAYFCDTAYFPAYRDLKEKLFPEQPPASTGIIVAGLLHPDFMIEIDATAVVGAGS